MWRSVVESFGYEEYSSPIIESADVFTASGSALDDQTYSFTDRGNAIIALRPDVTPGTSRMMAAEGTRLDLPVRLYSIAECLRYERPDKGRARDFWQLNAELFGVQNLLGDVEVIRLAHAFLRRLDTGGHDDTFEIRINSRTLTGFVMANYLGLGQKEGRALGLLLDQKAIMPADDFADRARRLLDEAGADDGYDKLRALLDAQTMADLPPEILASESVREIRRLFSLLTAAGVTNVRFDIGLQRGLDYYDGIVFEAYDTDPANPRALLGGGRYDGLAGSYGTRPLAAVGFAVGADAVEEYLRAHGALQELMPATRAGIVAVGDALKTALDAADRLRDHGINTEVDITGRDRDSQVSALAGKGVPYALIVTADAAEHVLVDLADGHETRMSLDEAAQKLVQ